MAWAHELDDKRTGLLFQLFNKDNWEAVDEIECFLFIFDRMPKRMRLTVDYKIQGLSNEEIAVIMNVQVQTVRKQLDRAKARLATGLI